MSVSIDDTHPLEGEERLVRIKGRSYEGESINVDDYIFEECEFKDCRMVYRGGHYAFENSRFKQCHWTLSGPASRTLAFLASLYAPDEDGGPGPANAFVDLVTSGKLKRGWSPEADVGSQ